MNTDAITRSLKILLILLLILGTFIWVISSLSPGRNYLDELSLSSPDGRHTLIIREWETLGGTGAEIFCKPDSGKKVKLGRTHADDCVFPFRDGLYTVDWKGDSVLIRYYSGRATQTDDPGTWDRLTLTLP